MSIVTPRDLTTEDTSMRPGDMIEKYNPVSGQNEKVDYANFNAEKVKTKVLWTGPLSTVSTPTSLDAGEKFSDWDIIIVTFNLRNNTDVSQVTPLPIFRSLGFNQVALYTAVGDGSKMRVYLSSDTTFELVDKTVTQGNISRIIGISL